MVGRAGPLPNMLIKEFYQCFKCHTHIHNHNYIYIVYIYIYIYIVLPGVHKYEHPDLDCGFLFLHVDGISLFLSVYVYRVHFETMLGSSLPWGCSAKESE